MDARTHGGDHVKRKILPIAAMASMLVSVASAQEGPIRAEIVARLPQSVGNIAITPDNQLIFSHHPFFSPDVRVAKLTSSTTFQPFPNADWNSRGKEPTTTSTMSSAFDRTKMASSGSSTWDSAPRSHPNWSDGIGAPTSSSAST